ncbi:hypothetical protein DFH01_07660 [Falsiroseomonas bella]|uniref:Uncharacterized protein n=1 Tax=Falsiroseomonas bella TaxID=2184016 RepID=A0A317FN96_9PROT|nr:hypothetical protein [Falsiroseomonas bella]PWS39106.1 hypothetical protein DFH01_07660 [Falsiroseomonas bella]
MQGAFYAAILVGSAMLGWLAFLLLPAPNGRTGFALPWYVVMPYLAGWALLSFRRGWLAAAFVISLPIIMSLAYAGGFIVGATTVFALGLPGVVFAAAAVGTVVYIFHDLDARPLASAWVKIHLLGALLCGVVLAALFFAFRPATGGAGIYGPSMFISLAFGTHAVASWLQLRAEGRGNLLPGRAVLLVCALVTLGAIAMGGTGIF